MRGELLALPVHALRRPAVSGHALAERVLEESSDPRLTALALALLEAERRYVWQPPGVDADLPRLVPAAERSFRVVEDAAAALVARGTLPAELVPASRPRGRVEKARRALALVRLVVAAVREERGPSIAFRELGRARRHAWILLSARQVERVPPLEMRDRAYTALALALQASRPDLLLERGRDRRLDGCAGP